MLLELKDIRKSYSNARKEVFNLLSGVDMTVPKGKVTALVGSNGTGKTTLFNIISGFEKDFQGQIFFHDREITGLPAHRISQMGIGRLFQGRQLMGELTLMENMKIASVQMAGESPFDFMFKRSVVNHSEIIKEQQAINLLTRFFGPGNKYLDMLDNDDWGDRFADWSSD